MATAAVIDFASFSTHSGAERVHGLWRMSSHASADSADDVGLDRRTTRRAKKTKTVRRVALWSAACLCRERIDERWALSRSAVSYAFTLREEFSK
jgi:hypothetical protein